MHSTATPLVERILVLVKGNGASLPYLDLPVSDLCAWKVERIHTSSGGGRDQEIIDIFDWVLDVSWRIWILDLINHGRLNDHTAQEPERPAVIMLIRRNSVEVWHIARIEKRGGDLFLEKIDTLPATGAVVEGEGPRDSCSRSACDFLGMSCVLERVVPHPEGFVCLSTGNKGDFPPQPLGRRKSSCSWFVQLRGQKKIWIKICTTKNYSTYLAPFSTKNRVWGRCRYC